MSLKFRLINIIARKFLNKKMDGHVVRTVHLERTCKYLSRSVFTFKGFKEKNGLIKSIFLYKCAFCWHCPHLYVVLVAYFDFIDFQVAFLLTFNYIMSHLNSEMFEWQKALFFISLNWVAFIHSGRFQIVEVIEDFILEDFFFEFVVGRILEGYIYLIVKRSEMSAEW